MAHPKRRKPRAPCDERGLRKRLVASRIGSETTTPKRPSQAALKLARTFDAPLDHVRATKARAIVAQLARKLTEWRREGE